MTQMESPKRKMQKKNDYQRHKLFRKIKRRRKAQAEAEQQIAEKQLRKKLKLPKFGDGKTREVYISDIHFNNDDAAGGVDRYGNKFDYVELPEKVVTARKIPTFKDIEKQIGRKITQDEIDKIVAVDPEIPIQLPNTPKEKGAYSPSITNEFINTVAGTAGDAANYLADKTGLPNLAPDEQLVETRDGDALFDLPGYGQAAKLGLYGLGRYGGKFGLKMLQNLARKKLLEREFMLSNVDKQLSKDIAYGKPWYDHELIISPFRNYSWINQNDGYPYALRPGQKSWDTNIIQDELKQGRKDLIDWVNNPEFIKAQQQNKAEAQQMGLEYIPLHERSTFKDRLSLLDDANTYKWYADNKASESGYVENPLGNYANLMHINLANVDPYRFTISHEGGHMLGMGGPDLPSSSSQSILKQLKYLKYKSRQVLKPGYWYNDQFDLSEYPYEAVQNLRNLGQELNLSVGQQYPGYKNALDIINNSEKTMRSFLKPYLKTDEESMPYVWKALVGTQFGLSPIYMNALDNKKYNSGKDIHIKKSKRGTFTKAAKQHGMSVQSFANKVLKKPSKYSAAMRKKANFARNASKWKH